MTLLESKARKPRKCYIAGSGSYGCLYDCAELYSSRKAAEDAIIERFRLARTRRAGCIRRSQYVDLGPSFGADFAEVVEADSVDDNWDSDLGEWKDMY